MSTVIPEWLQEHINQECPYCGAPIINNDLLTDRYCSNPDCTEHMAQKVVSLAQWFGIKDCGIATARKLVQRYHPKFHTQMILYWFKEPPALHLHEVGEICMIKGHQKKWREYCEGYDAMSQVVKSYKFPSALRVHSFMLTYTASLCSIKPRMLGKRLNIMMSGSFSKYRARADFVTDMNRKYGDVVALVDVGKRKTEVSYLVKEAHTTDHEKSAIAMECGIPIVTPAALDERLAAYVLYMTGGEGK